MPDISFSLELGIGSTIYGVGVGNWPWLFQKNRYEAANNRVAVILWMGPLRMTVATSPTDWSA